MRWQQLPDSLSTPQLIRKLNTRMRQSEPGAIIQHGNDASHPRPPGGPYFWQGLADPVNKRIGDMWIQIDLNV